MDGIRAPFDEEGEDAVAVVGEIDGFPIEDVVIGRFWSRHPAAKGDLIFAQKFCGGGDVRR